MKNLILSPKKLPTQVKTCVGISSLALFVSFTTPVFAESAPVFDADMLQQQFEAPPEIHQQDVLPPPPQALQGIPENNVAENTFVPMQNETNVVAAETTQSAPMPIEQRIHKVEQQISNIQNADVTARMESLQSQVQSLRGQVDALNHVLDKIQNQQKTIYSELDKKLAQQIITKSTRTAASTPAEKQAFAPVNHVAAKAAVKSAMKLAVNETTNNAAKSTTEEVPPATSAPAQPNVAEEQEIYQTAYNLIKVKKYNEAINVLQNMLQKYPTGQFASNAHYWLGELYGLLGKNDQALREFDTVVSNYPESPRVSDAQFKVGLIYSAQLKWGEAKTVFKKIINRYPGTTSSRLASEQLKQIKQSGH